MKKTLIILGLVVILLAASLATAWWWLTSTRSGAEFALNRAAGFVPSLSWDELEGGLASGLTLTGLSLDEADTRVAVDSIELAARIRLLSGPSLEIKWLRLGDGTIHLPPPDPDAPEPEPFELPDLSSPVPVTVNELLVERLHIIPAGAEDAAEDGEPITIERLALSGHYHDSLRLDRLELTMDDLDLDADGDWQLSEPHRGDLRARLALAIDETTTQHVEARVTGRLAALDIDFNTDGPANLEGQGRLRGLPDEIDASLSLSGALSEWPGLEFSAEDLELSVSGGPESWQAVASGRVRGPELPDNWLHADLSGSMTDIDIAELRVETLDGVVRVSGQAGIEPEPSADVSVALERIDFTALYPDWPEQGRVNGRVRLLADADSLRFEDLELSAPPTSLILTGSGRFEPETERLAVELNWRDLTWPPITDDSEPLASSESGQLRLTGALDDWRLELEAIIEAAGLSSTRLTTRADGDSGQARIEHLEVDADAAGRISGSGQFRWQPALAARADLELSAFDPGQFVPELFGAIDSKLSVNLAQTDDLTIDIERLGGTLRDQALGGSGRLRFSAEQPEAGRLDLTLGENSVSIDSDDGHAWSWRLEGDRLDQLWPDLSGQARIGGLLRLQDQTLSADGRLTDIAYDDIVLAEARLDAALGWGDQPSADISLVARDLDLSPWERIERLDASLDGGCGEHRFSLQLDAGRGSLDLAGQGELPGCLNGLPEWTGAIERLYLGQTAAGDFRLADAMPLTNGADGLSVGPGCLAAAGGQEGQLCLRSLTTGERGGAEVSVERLPMDLVLLAADPAFSLTNALSGEIEVAWSEVDGLERVAGFLRLDEGVLRPIDDDDQDLLIIRAVRLDLAPGEEQDLVVSLAAQLEGGSSLSGQARLADLNDPGSAEINAGAGLELPDIGIFNRLVPELDQLAGHFEANLAVTGTLFDPSLQGQARLSDGLVVHAPLGLTVSDIGIELNGDDQQARLNGRMRSGDGELELSGRMHPAGTEERFELALNGSQFSLADVDWLELAVSPRINLSAGSAGSALDGDVRIDRLRAGMPPGSAERVTASDDVRVRGEHDEADEDEVGARVRGRLGIDLGDDAQLSAIGLQTRLAGQIELLLEPGAAMPRGRGIVRLPEGSYRAYGQNLEISDGEIVFTGHPLDNPRLDISAVRDIFGDPQVNEAGVRIRGSARDPEISLFTEPPTSDEKALAYVVTGADFDHAGGQGAVNVGFYLLPRLFVSYGIGLFEAGNVLSGRYELSERWGVRVVSGERDTGVDLSFGVDR